MHWYHAWAGEPTFPAKVLPLRVGFRVQRSSRCQCVLLLLPPPAVAAPVRTRRAPLRIPPAWGTSGASAPPGRGGNGERGGQGRLTKKKNKNPHFEELFPFATPMQLRGRTAVMGGRPQQTLLGQRSALYLRQSTFPRSINRWHQHRVICYRWHVSAWLHFLKSRGINQVLTSTGFAPCGQAPREQEPVLSVAPQPRGFMDGFAPQVQETNSPCLGNVWQHRSVCLRYQVTE